MTDMDVCNNCGCTGRKMKRVSDSMIEMRELVIPTDTNLLRNLLGGSLMHWIDIAGAMVASKHANSVVATVAVDSVDFDHPIHEGEMVILKAKLTWVGRSSMEVVVEAFSENYFTEEIKPTNKAYLAFVALDENGKTREVPGLLIETEEERAECMLAEARRSERLKRKNIK